ICAVMSDFGGHKSSREKDLVDIVVFAVTHDIDGTALNVALETERQRRKIPPFDQFLIPPAWGPGYAKLSKTIPYCINYPTSKQAAELASQLIDPVISGESRGKKWSRVK